MHLRYITLQNDIQSFIKRYRSIMINHAWTLFSIANGSIMKSGVGWEGILQILKRPIVALAKRTWTFRNWKLQHARRKKHCENVTSCNGSQPMNTFVTPLLSDEIEPYQASYDSVEAFPSVTANRYDEEDCLKASKSFANFMSWSGICWKKFDLWKSRRDENTTGICWTDNLAY